ncbi:ABC transporter F family member 4 [Salarias fasciatus]|uniref:ABC transporter F family member 4 n=1 Tax=Salarias fasciatus TaxID=181472 RepID=UPI0011764CAE|nr:ABC transporter F family member 4-like [Salarias fasciatus]XP_029977133.1 ABC transporter F family member 4-like [Salarias fasciatus]
MEEEIALAETEQGEAVTSEGDAVTDETNSRPVKRGRGRPQGSKKLKVCVSEINVSSGDPNSSPAKRGRGRPKLSTTKHTEEDSLEDGNSDDSVPKSLGRGRPKGSKKQISEKSQTEETPKKRGRPRKSLSQSPGEGEKSPDLPNGGTDTPKRGRPKGSFKRKIESSESAEEGATPSKRGRPKGSLNKKPRLEREASKEDADADQVPNSPRSGRGRRIKVVLSQSASNGISKTPRSGRGRPRKNISLQPSDDSQPVKRGRGRPKGSSKEKPAAYKTLGKSDRLRKVSQLTAKGKKHGRPRLHPLPAKRGRPRKYPLPSPDERKKPKVWKPLGRPRKYSRVDPPEGALSAPRRSRGRPRKSESKKGAHLRKSVPAAPQQPYDGPPRKRGRPKKKEDGAPQKKRGRPQGSLKQAKSGTQPGDSLPNHSESPSEAATDKAEAVKKGAENVTASAEPQVDTEGSVIDQDAVPV